MSLGDLVISLSANTARFESDMGKAAQLVERWGNSVGNSAKAAEIAIAKMSSVGITSVDRLQQSFNSLNIKSGLQIDREAANIQAAFERIKNSGVASANEIKRANIAMKEQLDSLKNGNVMKGHIQGMNGFSLASVAAIAKIQVMYSLINNTMSAIGSMPGKAIDAIENYNTSLVTNAALITSMAGGTKNIGEEYKKNKVYAEAVEKVLVRMDTETSASYEQLQIMNRAYMQQGVYLDINNQKAIEGRRNTANALAVIAQATPNPNMQFGQEIRGLMNGTMKEGNALLKMLVGIDKDVVEKIERWKKAGTLDENIGKLLQGFAAAQGDIDNMWATVKSTMATIRDEVLRGGLAPAFGEIVVLMKDMNKWAGENKEKFQAFLKDSFADAKIAATYMWNLGKALSYFTEPAKYVAIALAFAAIATGISKINIALLATPIGRISALIGLAATATSWGIGKYTGHLDNEQAATGVRADAVGGKGVGSVELAKQREYMAQFNAGAYEQVKSKFPMMNDETISMLLKNKGIELQSEVAGVYGELATTVIFNEVKIKKLLEAPKVATPKPGKGGNAEKGAGAVKYDRSSEFNSFVQSMRTEMNNAEPDEFLRKIEQLDDRFADLNIKWKNLQTVDPAKAKEINKMYEGGIDGLMERTKVQEQNRMIAEQSEKREKAWNLEFKQFQTESVRIAAKEQADFKAAANERRNILEAEITNKLLQIDADEKLSKISGSEALNKRISLEQELVGMRQKFLDSMDKEADKAGWLAASNKVMQEQLKVNLELKKQFDATPMGGFLSSLQAYADAATNLGAQVSSFTTSVFSQMENQLVQFTMTGKFSFKDMTNSIIADLARIAYKQAILGPIANAFGGMMSGIGGGGYSDLSVGSKYTTASSGIPASLGSTSLKIAQFAVGTDYVPKTGIAVIHEGEAIIPASQNKGIGAAPTINIINNAAQDTEVKASQPRFDAGQWVVDMVIQKMRSDPGTRAAFAGGGNY